MATSEVSGSAMSRAESRSLTSWILVTITMISGAEQEFDEIERGEGEDFIPGNAVHGGSGLAVAADDRDRFRPCKPPVSLVFGWSLFASCAPAASAGRGNLSAAQKAAIGRKIWQNECAGSVDGLTTWNGGEEFPSLGIGHFIWYPAGFKGRFEESWPQFIAFAKQAGCQAAGRWRWSAHSPWNTKAEFQKDFKARA